MEYSNNEMKAQEKNGLLNILEYFSYRQCRYWATFLNYIPDLSVIAQECTILGEQMFYTTPKQLLLRHIAIRTKICLHRPCKYIFQQWINAADLTAWPSSLGAIRNSILKQNSNFRLSWSKQMRNEAQISKILAAP